MEMTYSFAAIIYNDGVGVSGGIYAQFRFFRQPPDSRAFAEPEKIHKQNMKAPCCDAVWSVYTALTAIFDFFCSLQMKSQQSLRVPMSRMI